jgi:two-component system nitrate/nitrite response regulator NarL
MGENANGKVPSLNPAGLEFTSKVVGNRSSAPRALIADRDQMTSQLLADALVRNRQYQASAVQAADLLRTLETHDIAVVIIGADLSSRVGAGFDLAGHVSKVRPKIAIVLLLDQPTRASVISAFRSGARGVFSRQQPIDEFLDCIDHVHKGFLWAGRMESTILLDAFRSIPAPVVSGSGVTNPLTMRELQVVRKASQGKTNRAIAAELGLSEHTIKNYLFHAFEKLGVSSRIELLFYLTTQGRNFGTIATEDAAELPASSSDREASSDSAM